jgi:hypothetical protein
MSTIQGVEYIFKIPTKILARARIHRLGVFLLVRILC